MEYHITINFPDTTIEKVKSFRSLRELDDFLNREFPEATSFVVVWSRGSK